MNRKGVEFTLKQIDETGGNGGSKSAKLSRQGILRHV
jgi:hypothetical protein